MASAVRRLGIVLPAPKGGATKAQAEALGEGFGAETDDLGVDHRSHADPRLRRVTACHPPRKHWRSQWQPGGFTLIELLVVVAIMLLTMVMFLPHLGTSTDAKRIRETTRSLALFLGAARAQAMESGRPVGVMLVRDPNNPYVCSMLYQVESPPPYSGDAPGVVASLSIMASGAVNAQITGSMTNSLVGIGDRFMVACRSIPYTVTAVTPPYQPPNQAALVTSLTLSGRFRRASCRGRHLRPPPRASLSRIFGVPQPPNSNSAIARSAGRQLALPKPVVIDLPCSGSEAPPPPTPPAQPSPYTPTNVSCWFGPASASDTSPITIMFAPNGMLDQVYYNAWPNGTSVSGPLYFLVGTRDKVVQASANPASGYPSNPDPYNSSTNTNVPNPNLPSEASATNFQDPSSLWLVLHLGG